MENNIDALFSKIEEYNTIIIGSGAAGLNCAIHLVEEGLDPNQVLIVTDHLGGGTSFNAGSDKQTYYKMAIGGANQDSPYEMAKDLFAGGAMHGDIALVEATNSVREFFHLVQLGLGFPTDKFGGFVGYKTDNDPRQRATSVGPMTSQYMAVTLLKAVRDYGIKILDNHHVERLICNDKEGTKEVMGVLCVKFDELSQTCDIKNFLTALRIYKARNIVLATGGPAILYKHSVYPITQQGTLSLAISAGCKLQNLTESQFGLADVKIRWNLSGSYQQVIPRYFSVDQNHNEVEFLKSYFPSFRALSKAIFLKGYQWPFNSERIENYGSSLIDLAVYHQTETFGNKVFLDYRKNPADYNFEELDPIVKDYLSKSNALGNTPLERLHIMNEDSVDLFTSFGVCLRKEPIQIAVCNQHLNGGVACDLWWESINIKHLFAVGEVNGSHGVHRPGGAALNAGQVGGLRAAQKICNRYKENVSINQEMFLTKSRSTVKDLTEAIRASLSHKKNNAEGATDPRILFEQIRERMSKFGSILRPLKDLEPEIKTVRKQLDTFDRTVCIESNGAILDYLRAKGALLTQLMFLQSFLNYHEVRGKSRGSFLIMREPLNDNLKEKKILPPADLEKYAFLTSKVNLNDKIQTIWLANSKTNFEWASVREIPKDFGWFESTWKQFKNGEIYD